MNFNRRCSLVVAVFVLIGPSLATVQDKNVVNSANFFFDEVNSAAARVSENPLQMSLRLILKADKSCSAPEGAKGVSCVYVITVSAGGNDNKVRNIEMEIWMKHDGSMEILGSKELPLSQENLSDSIYDHAVDFYVKEVNTASREISPRHPRLIHPRRLVKTDSECGRGGDCLLNIVFNADTTDDSIVDVALRVWRRPDGKLELLGAEELQPSSQFRRAPESLNQDQYSLKASETHIPKQHRPFVMRPMVVVAGTVSFVGTIFIIVGIIVYRRRQQRAVEEHACGTHVLI